MTTIAIFGNTMQHDALQEIIAAIQCLESNGMHIIVESQFAAYMERRTGYRPCATVARMPSGGCGLLLSFGGDGTFLHAVRWCAQTGTPILGINTGHLGYLAAMQMPSDPQVLADLIKSGNWHTERRHMLKVSVDGADAIEPACSYALNEVAVLKDHSATTIVCTALLGNDFMATYPGDGLLVSTPTGSTAYNLSAGGPVVQPTLDVWIVSPIASHTLTLRPLVVNTDRDMTISVQSRTGSYQLAVDGVSVPLPDTAKVRISRAPFTTAVVRTPDSSWLGTLSRKLLWGAHSK